MAQAVGLAGLKSRFRGGVSVWASGTKSPTSDYPQQPKFFIKSLFLIFINITLSKILYNCAFNLYERRV